MGAPMFVGEMMSEDMVLPIEMVEGLEAQNLVALEALQEGLFDEMEPLSGFGQWAGHDGAGFDFDHGVILGGDDAVWKQPGDLGWDIIDPGSPPPELPALTPMEQAQAELDEYDADGDGSAAQQEIAAWHVSMFWIARSRS